MALQMMLMLGELIIEAMLGNDSTSSASCPVAPQTCSKHRSVELAQKSYALIYGDDLPVRAASN